MFKKLLSVISVVALLFSFTPKVDAASFPDLPSWANKEIIYLNNEGVVNGLPDGTFGSTRTISRGDAALMIARAKGLDINSNVKKSSFPDVDKSMYYFGAIESAVKEGYLKGYANGKFGPKDTLTREQMAKIIADVYNYTGKGNINFPDINNSWAKKEIEAIANNGITIGTSDGKFNPKVEITRAEFSVMLARAMNDDFKVEPPKNMNVHFMNVGQGDATLIQTPNGKNILVDGGIKSAGQKVVSYLTKAGVTSIDLMVATHPDADHIGGLIHVLENVSVKKVLDSGKVHTTQTYLEYLTLIDEKNIPFEIPVAGDLINLDNDLKIQVLNSTNTSSDNNDSSIVLKITYDQVSFLLTGDATVKNENEMIKKFDVRSTILKAGHHGSNTSTSQEFVNAVKPAGAIFSYGEGNQYGHPHPDVVKRLNAVGSKIYSTAQSGDITVTTNGTTHSVSAKVWTDNVTPKPEPPKPEKPKPEPPKPSPDPGLEVKPGAPTKFKNCTEMRKYYPNGVKVGHPAYEPKHDRDKDGWACER